MESINTAQAVLDTLRSFGTAFVWLIGASVAAAMAGGVVSLFLSTQGGHARKRRF